MIGYKDLESLYNLILEWEKNLADFYDVAEYALHKNESKITVEILKDNHLDYMKVLKDVNLEDYGKGEWIQFTPDFDLKDIMPIGKVSRDSTPDEIINSILYYEEKIKDIYFKISEKIITANEKELFTSLVKFKNSQIVRIKQLLEFL